MHDVWAAAVAGSDEAENSGPHFHKHKHLHMKWEQREITAKGKGTMKTCASAIPPNATPPPLCTPPVAGRARHPLPRSHLWRARLPSDAPPPLTAAPLAAAPLAAALTSRSRPPLWHASRYIAHSHPARLSGKDASLPSNAPARSGTVRRLRSRADRAGVEDLFTPKRHVYKAADATLPPSMAPKSPPAEAAPTSVGLPQLAPTDALADAPTAVLELRERHLEMQLEMQSRSLGRRRSRLERASGESAHSDASDDLGSALVSALSAGHERSPKLLPSAGAVAGAGTPAAGRVLPPAKPTMTPQRGRRLSGESANSDGSEEGVPPGKVPVRAVATLDSISRRPGRSRAERVTGESAHSEASDDHLLSPPLNRSPMLLARISAEDGAEGPPNAWAASPSAFSFWGRTGRGGRPRPPAGSGPAAGREPPLPQQDHVALRSASALAHGDDRGYGGKPLTQSSGAPPPTRPNRRRGLPLFADLKRHAAAPPTRKGERAALSSPLGLAQGSTPSSRGADRRLERAASSGALGLAAVPSCDAIDEMLASQLSPGSSCDAGSRFSPAPLAAPSAAPSPKASPKASPKVGRRQFCGAATDTPAVPTVPTTPPAAALSALSGAVEGAIAGAEEGACAATVEAPPATELASSHLHGTHSPAKQRRTIRSRADRQAKEESKEEVVAFELSAAVASTSAAHAYAQQASVSPSKAGDWLASRLHRRSMHKQRRSTHEEAMRRNRQLERQRAAAEVTADEVTSVSLNRFTLRFDDQLAHEAPARRLSFALNRLVVTRVGPGVQRIGSGSGTPRRPSLLGSSLLRTSSLLGASPLSSLSFISALPGQRVDSGSRQADARHDARGHADTEGDSAAPGAGRISRETSRDSSRQVSPARRGPSSLLRTGGKLRWSAFAALGGGEAAAPTAAAAAEVEAAGLPSSPVESPTSAPEAEHPLDATPPPKHVPRLPSALPSIPHSPATGDCASPHFDSFDGRAGVGPLSAAAARTPGSSSSSADATPSSAESADATPPLRPVRPSFHRPSSLTELTIQPPSAAEPPLGGLRSLSRQPSASSFALSNAPSLGSAAPSAVPSATPIASPVASRATSPGRWSPTRGRRGSGAGFGRGFKGFGAADDDGGGAEGSDSKERRLERSRSSASLDFSKPVPGALLERRYTELTSSQRLEHYRLGLGVTATVLFAVGIVDFYRLLAVLSSPPALVLSSDACPPSSRLPLALAELWASVVCMIALLLTLHPAVAQAGARASRVARPRHLVALAYVASGLSLTLASAAFETRFALNIATSLMILFYALVGNVSALPFVHVLLVVAPTFALYALRVSAAYGLFGDAHRQLWRLLTGCELGAPDNLADGDSRRFWASETTPAFAEPGALLFVVAAILGSLSAAHSAESYERRRFVLVQRLTDENEKTDALLYRMLPPTVVAQLKQGFQVADEFDDVFILASDLCGFTQLSAASQPQDVMLLLSTLFSRFDELSEAMGVYKVQ